MKGSLSIDPERWYNFRLRESDDDPGYQSRRAALGMLLYVVVLFVINTPHNFPSYPLAYSLTVLPLTIARWSLFNHKKVSSAATFFSVSVFNLSGAINVILLLIVRPELLLFLPPDQFNAPRVVELGQPAGDSTVFTDPVQYTQSPQATGMGLIGHGESHPPPDSDSIALSPIESMRRSDAM